MVAVPLVALILLLGANVAERMGRLRNVERFVAQAGQAAYVDGLADEIEMEGSLSMEFVVGGGSRGASDLRTQWSRTDAALEEVEGGRAGALPFDPRLRSDLGGLGDMRRRVLDREATWPEVERFYSTLIEELGAVVDGVASLSYLDPQITALYGGFHDLAEATAAAAEERTLGSRILLTGAMDQSDRELLHELVGRQQASLRSFGHHFPSDVRATYRGRLDVVPVAPVRAARARLTAADLSLDPEAWFAVTSARIDAIGTIQHELMGDLVARGTELVDEARAAVWRFAILGVLIFAAALLVARSLGRRLARRIIGLAEAAEALGRGDFGRRADIGGSDELGALGAAFDRMARDLAVLNRTLESQVEARTAELATSEALVRSMLEAVPDLVLRLAPDGTCVEYHPPNAPGVFESAERVLGRPLADVLPIELASLMIAAARFAHISGRPQHIEYQLTIGGTLRDREARFVAIPGSVDTMGIIRDITERKAAERRLQELARSKDQLIASISHEIRTPLTAVVGFAEVLRDDEAKLSPAERDELIRSIAAHASDISHIVEDLLVAARTDIGTLVVSRVSVSLRAEVAKVLEVWQPPPDWRIDIRGDSMARGDPRRIRQILRNLLTNAARYGGDHVEVRIHHNGSEAILQVRDDGPGIPVEDRATVFEPYRRSATHPGQPGSVGLGLSVARTLARLMEGDLTYRYDDDRSVFELVLPVPD